MVLTNADAPQGEDISNRTRLARYVRVSRENGCSSIRADKTEVEALMKRLSRRGRPPRTATR
jgi:hypothetical protein